MNTICHFENMIMDTTLEDAGLFVNGISLLNYKTGCR